MDCVVETDRGFLCRDVPMPDLSNEKIFPGGIKVKALFTPNMKWRLVEEFGPNCFTRNGRWKAALFSRLYGYGKPCDMAYDIWSKSRGA